MSLPTSQPDVADRSYMQDGLGMEQCKEYVRVVKLGRIGDPDVLILRGLVAK